MAKQKSKDELMFCSILELYEKNAFYKGWGYVQL